MGGIRIKYSSIPMFPAYWYTKNDWFYIYNIISIILHGFILIFLYQYIFTWLFFDFLWLPGVSVSFVAECIASVWCVHFFLYLLPFPIFFLSLSLISFLCSSFPFQGFFFLFFSFYSFLFFLFLAIRIYLRIIYLRSKYKYNIFKSI